MDNQINLELLSSAAIAVAIQLPSGKVVFPSVIRFEYNDAQTSTGSEEKTGEEKAIVVVVRADFYLAKSDGKEFPFLVFDCSGQDQNKQRKQEEF